MPNIEINSFNSTRDSYYSTEYISRASSIIITPCKRIIVEDNFKTNHGRNYTLSLDANGKNLYTTNCNYGQTIIFNLDELNIQKNLQFKVAARYESTPEYPALLPCYISNFLYPSSEECLNLNDVTTLGSSYATKSNFILVYTSNITTDVYFNLTSSFKLIKL